MIIIRRPDWTELEIGHCRALTMELFKTQINVVCGEGVSLSTTSARDFHNLYSVMQQTKIKSFFFRSHWVKLKSSTHSRSSSIAHRLLLFSCGTQMHRRKENESHDATERRVTIDWQHDPSSKYDKFFISVLRAVTRRREFSGFNETDTFPITFNRHIWKQIFVTAMHRCIRDRSSYVSFDLPEIELPSAYNNTKLVVE